MPQDLNLAMVEGRLGADPELRYSPSGAAFCNGSVATTFRWKDKNGDKQEQTDWHNFVISGPSAETFAKFHKKGDIAFIQGRMTTRSYDDRDGNKRYVFEIRCDRWSFCNGNERRDNPQPQKQTPQTPPPQPNPDDEIPF